MQTELNAQICRCTGQNECHNFRGWREQCAAEKEELGKGKGSQAKGEGASQARELANPYQGEP